MIEEAILSNLRNSFSSAVQRIYIQSLGKTYTFREATVKEHSTLAKTVISNKDVQSVVYAATLSMMKNLCLEDDFDPLKMSEFDRLKVIVHLFSNNFFSKTLSLKCPHKGCDSAVKYSLKYGSLLKMLDSVDCSDIIFDNSSDMGKVRLAANFPSTMRYLSLLEAVDGIEEGSRFKENSKYEEMDKSFVDSTPSGSIDDIMTEKIRMRREILKGNVKKVVNEKKTILGNVDAKSTGKSDILLDLGDIYMKRIQITSIKGSENEFDIDMSGFGYEDTEKILSSLPMSLFVKEDGMNAIKFISRSIFSRMNSCVPKVICPKCGCNITERLTLPDFFIFG